ncbi:Hypothetical protein CAP_8313 [Chondromyces apiculatus DSM 436]|uniref:Uncharacterized protein n=2 Tax=Chondromyces apiculatus TaxID=51 RepID=A0A017SX74_9BACT|nr:Hypothetical protein CAP_8313 [Chondromyces apiculatus DSM 436]
MATDNDLVLVARHLAAALCLLGFAACQAITGLDEFSISSTASAPDPGAPEACQPGWHACDGTCTDLSGDPLHCGACGSACGTGEICVDAQCTCPSHRPRCAGGCVDLRTDPQHCGACEHDCSGQTCADALCAPELLMTGLGTLRALAVTHGALFWTEASPGRVSSIPSSGGARTDHATSPAPHALAVEGDTLCWTDSVAAEIVALDLTSGVTSVLATNQPSAYALALAGGFAYWTTYEVGEVLRIPRSGGPLEHIASSQVGAFGLAVGDHHVYWVNQDGGAILRSPLDGDALPEPIATECPAPRAIAVDESHVYWIDNVGIMRHDTLAGGPLVPLTEPPVSPHSFVLGGAYLYSTDEDGTIRRIPTAGGEPLSLAVDQALPSAIALDATHVYWHNAGDGTLMRVAR